jgi:hypothetical protein
MLRFQRYARSTLELEGRKPNLKKHRTEVTEVTEGKRRGVVSALSERRIANSDCSLRILLFVLMHN